MDMHAIVTEITNGFDKSPTEVAVEYAARSGNAEHEHLVDVLHETLGLTLADAEAAVALIPDPELDPDVEALKGTVDEVLAWVGDDLDRAATVERLEGEAKRPRARLIAHVEKMRADAAAE